MPISFLCFLGVNCSPTPLPLFRLGDVYQGLLASNPCISVSASQFLHPICFLPRFPGSPLNLNSPYRPRVQLFCPDSSQRFTVFAIAWICWKIDCLFLLFAWPYLVSLVDLLGRGSFWLFLDSYAPSIFPMFLACSPFTLRFVCGWIDSLCFLQVGFLVFADLCFLFPPSEK